MRPTLGQETGGEGRHPSAWCRRSSVAQRLRVAVHTDHAATMTAVALGKFDALHLGHRALAETVAALAPAPALLTFSGMAEVLGWPAREPLVATSDRPRIVTDWARLSRTTLGWIEQPFAAVRSLSPSDFIDFLRHDLAVTAVVVGEDFRFGRGRSGNADDLRRLAVAAGLAVAVVPHVAHQGVSVSSSRIRHLLESGEVTAAAAQLGRWHRVVGTVKRGDGRGRTLGFPTANCSARENLVPGVGVYACWAEINGARYPAALNIGYLPTISADRTLSVEAHLLGFSGDCYGQRLALDLVARVRDEQRFSSLEALKAQLARDVAQIPGILAAAG